MEWGRDEELAYDWKEARGPVPFELRYASALDVACITGSVIEPRRTPGSNCDSSGGNVVRVEVEVGGGVSMYIGVGPESRGFEDVPLGPGPKRHTCQYNLIDAEEDEWRGQKHKNGVHVIHEQ